MMIVVVVVVSVVAMIPTATVMVIVVVIAVVAHFSLGVFFSLLLRKKNIRKSLTSKIKQTHTHTHAAKGEKWGKKSETKGNVRPVFYYFFLFEFVNL